MTIEEILRYLPHRYPFLLVDRVTDIELDRRIEGYKNVSINEPFFQGHFPAHPVMPGVLIIEAMAQLSGAGVPFARPDAIGRRRVLPGGHRQGAFQAACGTG